MRNLRITMLFTLVLALTLLPVFALAGSDADAPAVEEPAVTDMPGENSAGETVEYPGVIYYLPEVGPDGEPIKEIVVTITFVPCGGGDCCIIIGDLYWGCTLDGYELPQYPVILADDIAAETEETDEETEEEEAVCHCG